MLDLSMQKSSFQFSPKVIILLGFFTFSLAFMQSAKAQFVKGADIGWLSQMEATGYKFYNSAGVQTECMLILKDKEINTIRLRVWVNPSNHKTNGHCSKKETVVMAIRAKAMGMRVMIDFHYSDSWADPGKQTKPAAWSTHTFSQLLDDVYNHTFEVLDTLKQCGVTPDWAQIGNEIRGGMLWPDGKTSNWPNLGKLLNKGYDAAKAVDSSIQVVIHLEGGNENSKCRSFFDNAKIQGVRYDVIGLSYYPYWISPTGFKDYNLSINDLGNNMNDMASRYGKEVMIVEVGGPDNQVQNTYDMLVAVIKKTMAVPGNKGMGVIYWEPQGERNWSGGYPLSCWGSNGRPTAALDAFLTNTTGLNPIHMPAGFTIYPNPCDGGILNFEFRTVTGSRHLRVYDIYGKLMQELKINGTMKYSVQMNLLPGVYFVNVDSGNYSDAVKLVVK
jgi:arabinogalactan endo-1,4-beta-galactosidase